MTSLSEKIRALIAIIDGFTVTGGHTLRKPVTFEYPGKRKPVSDRFKGRHILRRYSNGLERCIGCSLCAATCPSAAIYVEAAENNPDNPVSPGERYAEKFEINLARCIFCGFCQDACPVEAIMLGREYELSDYSRDSMIISKDDILLPVEQGEGENLFGSAMRFPTSGMPKG